MNLNMNKYIDTDSLRKEIGHRIDILEDMSIKCAKNDDTEMHAYYHGKAVSLQELLSFIDSFQQEQPEPPKIEIAEYYYHKGVYEGLSQGRADALKILDEFMKVNANPVIVIKQQEQPKVDLEKASRNVYESWMGGTMDDVRRDMVELGKALNARKEE